MRRRGALSVLGTGLLAGCTQLGVPDLSGSTDGEATATPPPEPETRDGELLHGLFGGDPTDDLRRLDAYERWTGEKPAVLSLYVAGLESEAWTRTFVGDWMDRVWQRGHVPAVSWMPQPSDREEAPTDVTRRLAAGEYDGHLETWAETLASWVQPADQPADRRFYFRPAYEMNGDWFPWRAVDSASTPADYVEMWRRLHGIFAEAGLASDHVQWVWSPNVTGKGDYALESYYPGDDYVDWVGVDGFNFGDTESWSAWLTPKERFGHVFETIRTFSDKPLALSEVATSSFRDGDYDPAAKARWIRRFFAFVASEDVKMVMWFNLDKEDHADSDWAVFGGERGTDQVSIDGRTYPAYADYATEVGSSSVLSAYPDYARRLTDAEFTGRF